MSSFDAIVIGTGGVGSAALFHLARRGAKVLGLDRFPGGHDRGSSHGETRIIRQAYFEHPSYTPLLKRAYELWADLEQRRGEKLFFQTGILEIGPPDGVVVPGVLASAQQHGLQVDRLTAAEVAERFPGLAMPPGCAAVYERSAGYLLVEKCVLAHLAEAQQHGAQLQVGEAVRAWSADDRGVKVETETEIYIAKKLVVAAGAWARDLLADLRIPLRVLRKHLHWFACDDRRYHQDEGCPAFFYELPSGYYYGFPQMDRAGVKAAEHSGGAEVGDPLTDSRDVEPDEAARVAGFIRDLLPGVSTRRTRHAVCYYTMSPDEHFIVDRHPQFERVALVAGLSGHGFKFTSVLGEVLADLTLDGATQAPVEFLNCRREALRVER